jgi:hypothetical protein
LFYGRYYYLVINIETKVSSYGCPDLAMAKACFKSLLETAINADFLLLK